MEGAGKRKFVLIIATLILLCAIIPSVYSEDQSPYICIGECNSNTYPIPENHPPVFDLIGNQVVSEGSLLTFSINTSDPDDDILYFIVSIPPGSSVTLSGGNLTFKWTPTYTQSGTYIANFSVTDGGGLTDHQDITITVTNVNRPPQLSNPGDQTIAENSPLTFTLSATDPDGDPVNYGNMGSLPGGASLNASTGDFTWIPTYDQDGIYMVNFSAMDPSGLKGYASMRIIVINVNRPPELGDLSDRTVAENSTLIVPLLAIDADGDTIIYGNVTLLPIGAKVNKTTGIFSWTPSWNQSGTYLMNFSATDGEYVDHTTLKVSVSNVNRPPRFNIITDSRIAENTTLVFTCSAIDPDGDTVTYGNVSPLPNGATLNVTSGVFRWTPTYTQHGNYSFNFSVSDGVLKDYETTNITVTDVNGAPVIEEIGKITNSEGIALSFHLNITDPDNDSLIYQAFPLPDRATFNQSTGNFSWIPAYNQAGTYKINFTATDPGKLINFEVVTIEIVEPDQISAVQVHYAPVFDQMATQTIDETYTLTFTVHAFDYDSSNLIYKAISLPSGATFNPSTRLFTWTPPFAGIGNYVAKFSVSDGSNSDTLSVTINVTRQPMPTHDCDHL